MNRIARIVQFAVASAIALAISMFSLAPAHAGGIWADNLPKGGIWADNLPKGGIWADNLPKGALY